jgi:phosphoribosylanthranilate isomerase
LANALGLVSRMPSGPGPIPDELIAEIAAVIPPSVATFLLTALTDPEAIIAQHRRCGTSVIQLVDTPARGAHAGLRRALPGSRLVQVVHVRSDAAVTDAAAVAPHVDAILLDSGNPDLAIKELGGTDRTHDWGCSRRIVETCGRPVFLAGGLRPDNLRLAHAKVRPLGYFGVRYGMALFLPVAHKFYKLTALPALPVLWFVVVGIHELGHVVGGWLGGGRFLLWLVGPLKIWRSPAGIASAGTAA